MPEREEVEIDIKVTSETSDAEKLRDALNDIAIAQQKLNLLPGLNPVATDVLQRAEAIRAANQARTEGLSDPGATKQLQAQRDAIIQADRERRRLEAEYERMLEDDRRKGAELPGTAGPFGPEIEVARHEAIEKLRINKEFLSNQKRDQEDAQKESLRAQSQLYQSHIKQASDYDRAFDSARRERRVTPYGPQGTEGPGLLPAQEAQVPLILRQQIEAQDRETERTYGPEMRRIIKAREQIRIQAQKDSAKEARDAEEKLEKDRARQSLESKERIQRQTPPTPPTPPKPPKPPDDGDGGGAGGGGGPLFDRNTLSIIRFTAALAGAGIGINVFGTAGHILHNTLVQLVQDEERILAGSRDLAAAFRTTASTYEALALTISRGGAEGGVFSVKDVQDTAVALRPFQENLRLSTEQMKQLVFASAQLANIHDIPLTQAATTLGQALTGNSDAAGQLGLALTDVTVAAHAANGAYSAIFSTLTDNQRATLTLAEAQRQIAQQTVATAGKLDPLAEASRKLGSNWDELNKRLGDPALHVAAAAVDVLSRLLDYTDKKAQDLAKDWATLVELAATGGGKAAIFPSTTMPGVPPEFANEPAKQSRLVEAIKQKWAEVQGATQTSVDATDAYGNKVEDTTNKTNKLGEAWDGVRSHVGDAWQFIQQSSAPAVQAINDYQNKLVETNETAAAIGQAFSERGTDYHNIWTKATADVRGAQAAIEDHFNAVRDGIADTQKAIDSYQRSLSSSSVGYTQQGITDVINSQYFAIQKVTQAQVDLARSVVETHNEFSQMLADLAHDAPSIAQQIDLISNSVQNIGALTPQQTQALATRQAEIGLLRQRALAQVTTSTAIYGEVGAVKALVPAYQAVITAQQNANRAQQDLQRAQHPVTQLDLASQQRRLEYADQLASLQTDTLNRQGAIVDLQRQEADLADRINVASRENLDLQDAQIRARQAARPAANALNALQYEHNLLIAKGQELAVKEATGQIDASEAARQRLDITQKLNQNILAQPAAKVTALEAERPVELIQQQIDAYKDQQQLVIDGYQREKFALEDSLTPLLSAQRITDEITKAIDAQIVLRDLADTKARTAATERLIAAQQEVDLAQQALEKRQQELDLATATGALIQQAIDLSSQQQGYGEGTRVLREGLAPTGIATNPATGVRQVVINFSGPLSVRNDDDLNAIANRSAALTMEALYNAAVYTPNAPPPGLTGAYSPT